MSYQKLPFGINAWIFLNEDEPSGTDYNSPNSCFQTLINYKIYDCANFIGLAFFEVVPAKQGTTIQIGNGSHPNGLTNQDYMNFILRDAPMVNPNIKFLATMGYNTGTSLPAIFAGGGDEQTAATDFANNLVAYLKQYGMNGFDIDWEGAAEGLTQSQFRILFSTIREVFDKQSEKYYLSFTPAWPSSGIDYSTVNSDFDFVSPQLYDGTPLDSFLSAGISPSVMGYGAQFEPGNSLPNASAQQVYSQVANGFQYGGSNHDFQDIFMWRLNSNNFQFEQAQFMILHELFNPPAGNDFDDSMIVAAAGNPNITSMTIRSGEVLNAIQTVNTGTGPHNFGTQPSGTTVGIFTLPQHGGDSGTASQVTVPAGDPIVEISGYTGVWYGWNCVLQLSLKGKSGKTYGPYGNMGGATSKNPFTQTAPAGQSVVAFRGSTVNVPLAGGSRTDIIASLDAVFG